MEEESKSASSIQKIEDLLENSNLATVAIFITYSLFRIFDIKNNILIYLLALTSLGIAILCIYLLIQIYSKKYPIKKSWIWIRLISNIGFTLLTLALLII